jgi:uncharacterized MAPEG superfamily protein
MKKIIKDCFTGSDNETYSLLKIAFAIVQIVYIGCAIWDCYLTRDFKMLEFAGGESGLIAAFGSAMWMSKDIQPFNQKSPSAQ